MASISLPYPIPRFPAVSSALRRRRIPFPLRPVRFPSIPLSSPQIDPTLHRPRSHITLSSSSNGEFPILDEAREAVAQVLQELGASREDSVEISSNSPKYIENLVGGVRELDEHSLWSSWGDDGAERDAARLSFKEKVYLMAKRKEDGGIVAFLESVGLSHVSAIFIARYLASKKLPELIRKVKFVKEMIFSSNIQKALIGRNARRMMMHLSISVDDDVQRTLSFFEKMEARHGGLDMLGYQSASLPYLIESFPNLLSRSVENHLKPLAESLEQAGVPKSSVGVVFLLFPPVLFYDIEKDIYPRMQALEKAGVENRKLGKVLLKYPWILSTSVQKNYGKICAFFAEQKVPKSSMDLGIRNWPHLLGCSTGKMKSILKKFGELGVEKNLLVPVITSSPQLLLRKPKEFLKVVALMEEVGLDNKSTGRILCRCPEIFGANVDNTLRKKLNFLTDFGVPKDRLARIIRKYPEFLGLDLNNTLLPRMRYLMGIGLSKRDVCSMICRFSPLLGYSIDVVFQPKVEFLLKTMQRPLKEIVEYPRYFSYSLDKKIKPRFWVVQSRNADCSLQEMLAKNDEEFVQEFIGNGSNLVASSRIPPDDS